MSNEHSEHEIPDLRSTFYVRLAQLNANNPQFDNPREVYEEALGALTGRMDMDTLFGAALPLFHRLGIPLPKIPIIIYALTSPDTTVEKEEVQYLIRVLNDTGSADIYRSEIDAALMRF